MARLDHYSDHVDVFGLCEPDHLSIHKVDKGMYWADKSLSWQTFVLIDMSPISVCDILIFISLSHT